MKRYLFAVLFLFFLFPTTAYAKENDTYISKTAYEACIQYGEEYNICPELLMAIIEKESDGRPDAENGNCKGNMQVDVVVHKERMERLDCTDIFDEEQNIHVGTDYLAELIEKYEDIYLVLMGYNMGEAGMLRLYKQGIYVSDYAVEICDRSAELESLHGK